MKKLIAIVLTLTLCLSLCSCSLFDKVTAASLFAKAVETLAETKNYEADCNVTMSMDLMGMNMDIGVDMNLKVADKDMQISMSILGQDVVMTMLGNIMYMDVMGGGMKYTVQDTEKAEEEIMSDTMAKALPEISSEVLDATELVENEEDGTKELTVSLTSEQSAELLGMANAMYENMSFEDIKLTVRFDAENELTGFSVIGTYKATEEDITLAGDVSATYTFVNLGEVPEITLPLAEEDYVDGGIYEENAGGIM